MSLSLNDKFIKISNDKFTKGLTKIELIIDNNPIRFNCFYDGNDFIIFSGFIQQSRCSIDARCKVMIDGEMKEYNVKNMKITTIGDIVYNNDLEFNGMNQEINCGNTLIINNVNIEAN